MDLLPAYAATPRTDLSALTNKILCCDAMELLRQLPDGSMDLFVTSPPYNLNNSVGGGNLAQGNNVGKWKGFAYDNYSDDMPHEDYVIWQRQIVTEMYRALKPTGAIYYNHKWRVQDGLIQRLPEQIMEGFPIRQIIIWYRHGGHNFNITYHLPTYELIYIIAKPEFKLTGEGSRMHDVWSIPPVTNKFHPVAFPEVLVAKILIATGAKFVCDPFIGGGTTAFVAQKRGVNYLGCDISAKYVNEANAHLHNDVSDLPLFAKVSA